jgi:hypothetical protein
MRLDSEDLTGLVQSLDLATRATPKIDHSLWYIENGITVHLVKTLATQLALKITLSLDVHVLTIAGTPNSF